MPNIAGRIGNRVSPAESVFSACVGSGLSYLPGRSYSRSASHNALHSSSLAKNVKAVKSFRPGCTCSGALKTNIAIAYCMCMRVYEYCCFGNTMYMYM